MNKSSGFTLIEMMVTIAIAGVLAAIAIPSFNAMVSNNRVSTVANEFVASSSFARQEAMKRGAAVTVCRSSSGSACSGSGDWEAGWIVFTDPDRNGSIGGSEVILRTRAAFGNGNNFLKGQPAVKDRVTLTDQGMAMGFAGSFTACDKKLPANARFIDITPTGRTVVYDRSSLPGTITPPGCPS